MGGGASTQKGAWNILGNAGRSGCAIISCNGTVIDGEHTKVACSLLIFGICVPGLVCPIVGKLSRTVEAWPWRWCGAWREVGGIFAGHAHLSFALAGLSELEGQPTIDLFPFVEDLRAIVGGNN